MNTRKTSITVLAALMIFSIAGCGGSSETTPASQATQMVQTALQQMDEQVEATAASIPVAALNSPEARENLLNLCTNQAAAVDCATISTSGTLVAVEPPKYSAAEGTDISQQEHWILLSQTHRPVLSNLFKTVEGPFAVDLGWPLFDPADVWSGSVSLLIDPATFVSTAIVAASSEIRQGLMVLQTDGTIIFESDPNQIGLNTFTDPAFLSSPSLQELAHRVVSEQIGTGTYQFTAHGSNEVVTKQADWDTATLHDTQWRVVVMQESRP